MQLPITKAIENALTELGVSGVSFVVDYPTDAHTDADYFSNVAFAAGKRLGQAPRQAAEQLASVLAGKVEQVDRIEVAGPGFLNFYLTREYFSKALADARAAGPEWGRNQDWNDAVVIVEYTDPNPFKELHIGHLVPNALGESLARLFMLSGAETRRVTFQGDVGMHVAKAIFGLMQSDVAPSEIDATALGQAYAAGSAAFESSAEAQADIKTLNKVIYEQSDPRVVELYVAGKEASLAYFEAVYQILGSQFDTNFFESETGPVGLALVRQHIGDVFTESDGAVIFKGEQYGLHTRVFVNSEGLPTYETKDVGLIVCKDSWSREQLGRSFDLTITVTGTEQQEYFKVTTKASELIQPDLAGKVELVPNGMLRLAEGKMSSRTGDVVRALQLIGDVTTEAVDRMRPEVQRENPAIATQVAVGAIKYSILKIAPGKDIVFDLKKSISFEGDSGPYLQYTYARIQSVLAKAAEAGVIAGTESPPRDTYLVEKLIERFPVVLQQACAERAPHHVVTYLTELAGAFNSFYATEKIADSADQSASYKLALTELVGQTLKTGLWTLGIEAPERL